MRPSSRVQEVKPRRHTPPLPSSLSSLSPLSKYNVDSLKILSLSDLNLPLSSSSSPLELSGNAPIFQIQPRPGPLCPLPAVSLLVSCVLVSWMRVCWRPVPLSSSLFLCSHPASFLPLSVCLPLSSGGLWVRGPVSLLCQEEGGRGSECIAKIVIQHGQSLTAWAEAYWFHNAYLTNNTSGRWGRNDRAAALFMIWVVEGILRYARNYGISSFTHWGSDS